jgi:phosphatidylserine/phosphatidylglycerophosphate/cardiolipin synthase-like enzyme
MTSRLVRTVVRIVAEGDPATVRILPGILARNSVAPLEEMYALRPASADPHTLALVEELVQEVRSSEATPALVGDMVRAAIDLRELMERTGESSTLVWTGPAVRGSTLRTTAEAMAEIIEGARSQILVSTYSLRQEVPDPGRGLLARLGRARERGVGVTLVVHQDEANRTALRAGWPPESPAPRLLTWPTPEGDEMVKLHAKIVVADDRTLLVTSANLTYHGLFANLELGILVRGSVAGEVRRHFDRLERQGHLGEWS